MTRLAAYVVAMWCGISQWLKYLSKAVLFCMLRSIFALALGKGFPTWRTCTPGGTFAYPKGYI